MRRASLQLMLGHGTGGPSVASAAVASLLESTSTRTQHLIIDEDSVGPQTSTKSGASAEANSERVSSELDVAGLLFDLDGDQKLNRCEWYAMQPDALRKRHSREQIIQWYEDALRSVYADGVSLEHGGHATLSLNEFFLWALAEAGRKFDAYLAPLQLGANALGRAFASYDGNSNGELDYDEFRQLCSDLGFINLAKRVFETLDTDESGTLSYAELVQSITTAIPRDMEAKGFLTALVLTLGSSADDAATAGAKPAAEIATSALPPIAVDRASDAAGLQRELQRVLHESGLFAADLISLFDDTPADEDALLKRSKIDEGTFYAKLRSAWHYDGPRAVSAALFSLLDIYHDDTSGEIGFDEVRSAFRGGGPPFHLKVILN